MFKRTEDSNSAWMPEMWNNEGKGGVTVTESGGVVYVKACTGQIVLNKAFCLRLSLLADAAIISTMMKTMIKQKTTVAPPMPELLGASTDGDGIAIGGINVGVGYADGGTYVFPP